MLWWTWISRRPASRSSVIVDRVKVIVWRNAEKLLSASTLVHGRVPPIRKRVLMFGNTSSSADLIKLLMLCCRSVHSSCVQKWCHSFSSNLSDDGDGRSISQKSKSSLSFSKLAEPTAEGKSRSSANPTRSNDKCSSLLYALKKDLLASVLQ